MNVLNRLFMEAASATVLQPLELPAIKFQCSFYANDVILFCCPLAQEAGAIKCILDIFGAASGLHTNMSKCSITPVHGAEDELTAFQEIMSCPVMDFLVRYLGLPLSVKKVPKPHLQSLVNSVAAKLPQWQGPLMARSGRLIWINSVLMSAPIYAMMEENLPSWVCKEIDAICRRFLWARRDGDIRGKCMVAWPTVCRPKELGGLGVTDLKLSSYALQVRWLWLQRTDQERAWVELPLHVDPTVRQFFNSTIVIPLTPPS